MEQENIAERALHSLYTNVLIALVITLIIIYIWALCQDSKDEHERQYYRQVEYVERRESAKTDDTISPATRIQIRRIAKEELRRQRLEKSKVRKLIEASRCGTLRGLLTGGLIGGPDGAVKGAIIWSVLSGVLTGLTNL
jgi:hypothetical protein